MTRGNQRENDRARAQARLAKNNAPKTSAADLTKKQGTDADAMRKKQQAADAKREADAAAAAASKAGGQVVKQKL